MGKKLYVGNLPFSVTDESLHQAFSQYGTVDSAKVIFDRETNRSKGFAFVEMANEQEADEAISGLNGKEFMGRAINVNEARPQEPRSQGGFRGGNQGRRNF